MKCMHLHISLSSLVVLVSLHTELLDTLVLDMDLKIDVSQRMDVNLRAKTRRKTA